MQINGKQNPLSVADGNALSNEVNQVVKNLKILQEKQISKNANNWLGSNNWIVTFW